MTLVDSVGVPYAPASALFRHWSISTSAVMKTGIKGHQRGSVKTILSVFHFKGPPW